MGNNIDLIYNDVFVSDIQQVGMDGNINGIFNIPTNDTTHIWELNFENNYLEIHERTTFKYPNNCFIVPCHEKFGRPFFIKEPILIKCFDGDSIIIDGDMFIDTGSPHDISIFQTAKEFSFFNEKENGIWLYTANRDRYFKYDIVNAYMFDNYSMDSLRIYSRDVPNRMIADYFIGLNFLKRFNVFFDIGNNQIGFQPIDNFQRVVNPGYIAFHAELDKTLDGTFIVKKIANTRENVYKEAGIQEGDEIIAVNGIRCSDMTEKDRDFFNRQDSLVYTVVRDRKQLTATIFPMKEEQIVIGD